MNDLYNTILPGVLYRRDATPEAYDEAIRDLQAARDQIAAEARGEPLMGCAVCGDSGHDAGICHHNPLLMARRAIMAAQVWRCYHCNAVFTDPVAAEEHFGRSEDEVARCLTPT